MNIRSTNLFFLAISLVWFSTALQGQKRDLDFRVDSLLRLMTLEEKIGQMTQYNGFWEVTGPVPAGGDAKKKYDHLKSGLVGSMLNVTGVEQVRKMQEMVVKETRLGIPLIFGLDVIHGHRTVFPIPLAEAASWDLGAIEQSARTGATEASARGVNWTFGPMVDISRDARWGRVMEGAGEDPYLGAKIAAARVKGFQGNDLASPHTIAACAKHFAGYGFAEAGRDYNTVDVGTSTIYNAILPPFKAAAEAGVRTFMNSFNVLNGIPATGNAFLQREVLKGKWGFTGFVVSDWGSAWEMMDHGFARDLKHAAELAANAGSDMDMESYGYVNHLKALVEEGKVTMGVVDDAVRRILRVKFELGLIDDPYRYCDENREKTLVGSAEHHAAALDVAKKSIVLLKNEGGLLPLSKNQQKIGLIGVLASEKNSPLGSWRFGSIDSSAVSVLEGMRKISKEVAFAQGPSLVTGVVDFGQELRINETDRTGMKEAIALAKKSGVVVLVLGDHALKAGEGRSRADLGLPGLQQELLEAVYAVNKNIVLVLMNGRPLTIPWAASRVPAIVEAWHLGSESGNAIAQTLFGDNNPSGKLPMSFPKSVGQLPLYYNHYATGRPGPKPDVFWSHYTDESNDPLYPFGFGLSYTTFAYSDLQVQVLSADRVSVQASVKNTGNLAGEEVVQLYLRDKVASVVRPVKELKGFRKLSLKPGEAATVRFDLSAEELGFYTNTGEFVVEPGEFEVLVGGNSNEGLKGRFELPKK